MNREPIDNRTERRTLRWAFGLVFAGIVAGVGLYIYTLPDSVEEQRLVDVPPPVAQPERDVPAGSIEANIIAAPTEREEPAYDLGIFPASVIEDGWEAESAVKEFDSTTLFDRVGGRETQYMAHGFQRLYFIWLSNQTEQLNLEIELFDMGSFGNSFYILQKQKAAGTKIEKAGTAYVSFSRDGGLANVGQYYFKFTSISTTPKIEEHVLKIIGDFASLHVGTVPQAFSILADGMGVDVDNIEYKPQNVFQYAFCKNFWFGSNPQNGKQQYFVHEAPSDEAAATMFNQILEKHAWDYTVVSKENARAMLQHNFLKTFFSIEQRRAFIYGVDQAANPTEAQDIDKLGAKIFEA